MADNQIGDLNMGFVNKQRSVINTNAPVATIANYGSVGALRTRLAAINGTYYTAARLNTMSVNDMQYAVRLNDDPTTIG